jgi:acyl dehydratase
MPKHAIRFEELPRFAGKELGSSDWFEMTQEKVNAFAEATGDEQWIHVDVERAKKESPFGGPIAHGYFTLSLISHFTAQIWKVTDASMAVNYGLNKVRFPAPVRVGARIRGHAVLQQVEEVKDGLQLILQMTVEIEGVEKPACAAEVVFRVYR